MAPEDQLKEEKDLQENSEKEMEEIDFLTRAYIEVEKLDINIYRSKNNFKPEFIRSVYGGQLMGQCMRAASLDITDDKHIHSFHAYFVAKGNQDPPIVYHVDKIREGQTYSTRSVKANQNGRTIFTMQLSFKSSEDFQRSHQLPIPDVPHPDELQTFPELLLDLKERKEMSNRQYEICSEYYGSFPIISKWILSSYFTHNTPSYPRRVVWLKLDVHLGDVHPNVHKFCIAYMSDLHILQTSLLPFGKLHKRIFHASLDHSMWFHADCRADEWILFEIESESTGDGRSLCHGRMWNLKGALVATVSQEGVMRTPNDELVAKL